MEGTKNDNCFGFSLLPHGVNSIYLEIFDECSFKMDELIAWTHIPIPQNVMNGETHEDWFPLSGKQGEGVEGMINLVISFAVSIKFEIDCIELKIHIFDFINKLFKIKLFSQVITVFIRQYLHRY